MTKNKTGVQVAGAGILGAVIGAAVGAGAVTLSSEKNRTAIKNKFDDLKKQGQKVMSDMQNKAEELTATGKKKVEEKVNEVKSKTEAVKKDIASAKQNGAFLCEIYSHFDLR